MKKMALAREQLLGANGTHGGSDDDADDFRKQIFRLFNQLRKRNKDGTGNRDGHSISPNNFRLPCVCVFLFFSPILTFQHSKVWVSVWVYLCTLTHCFTSGFCGFVAFGGGAKRAQWVKWKHLRISTPLLPDYANGLGPSAAKCGTMLLPQQDRTK